VSQNSTRISVLIKKLLLMNRGDATRSDNDNDKDKDQFEGETSAKKSERKKIRQELVQVLNVNVKDRELQ
jgi:hypothetical protein